MSNIIPRKQEGGISTPGHWRDPFEVMRDLLGLDTWGDTGRIGAPASGLFPPFEVKETRDAYVFKADVPGVKEEELDVSLTGNRLTISGKRLAEERSEGERYYAYERAFGSFSRSFTLPDGCDTEHVNADLRHGVLTITLPKKAEVQPKRIAVMGGSATKQEKARA